MDFTGIFTLSIVLLMFIALTLERFEAELVVFCTLVVFLISRIITPSEAFSGFSNEGTLTIAALFIIASTMQNNQLFKKIPQLMFGGTRNLRQVTRRLMAVVSGLSMFISNTAVVTIFTPLIQKWSKKTKRPPTKLLIPLSYAAIIGGVSTLIGTSTNLIIHTMLQEAGYDGFSMFQLALVGIPSAVIGMIYMILIGQRLLPYNRSIDRDQDENKDYLVTVKVKNHCPLIGQTVKEAKLRNMDNLYLIGIIRKDTKVFPVTTSNRIFQGDQLIFTGMVSELVELEAIQGISIQLDDALTLQDLQKDDIHLSEIVISKHSRLNNRTLKQCQFRSTFQAVVIAVFRNGQRINAKPGSIVLKPGDVLLTLSDNQFHARQPYAKDFHMISMADKTEQHDTAKVSINLYHWIEPAIFLSMIIVATTRLLPVVTAAFLAVTLLFITRRTTTKEALMAIDWRLIILIGSAFGIAEAIKQSGVATAIANWLGGAAGHYGPILTLLAVYLITNITTEMITNNAAAALVMPIVFSFTEQMGYHPEPFAMIVALAASFSFATPIGYQTNLIVYGAGGYQFKDFLKVGLPLNLLFMFISVIIVSQVWPLQG